MSKRNQDQLYLDFEFAQVAEPNVRLVCCTTFDPKNNHSINFWLHDSSLACDHNREQLRQYLKKFKTLIGYSCVAEARSLLALGLNPLDWDWIDLFLEARLIGNHNDRINTGNQLVNGRVKYYKKLPPKWERVEGETGFKPTYSLAEVTYKLTGEIRNTKHKDEMRDLIISNPDRYTPEQSRNVMDYCAEDVLFLPEINAAIRNEYFILTSEEGPGKIRMGEYENEAKVRGRYSAQTALMENLGYPIDLEAVRNFAAQIPHILFDMQREINKLFPNIKPFRWNKLTQKYSTNEKILRDWIAANHDVSTWVKTDSGKTSLSLEAWQKFYNYAHDYPTHLFGAQIVRFLKLKQSLYGFTESKTKGSFFDAVGSDGRVRPYMNIYGAQSSRSQPGAKAFMFLKPAWMRALVQPKPGMYCAGIDWASQEFFLSGLESRDENMIQAYLSGDPYFAFAKLAGVVPSDAVKADYKKERDLCKATVLGLSYMMSKYGLAVKLTNDTGREWDEDEAQEQIDLFNEAFPDFRDWQDELIDDYGPGGSIRLADGWRMWGDNSNHRSVGNVPIQGFGAAIMRKAVDLAVSRGCKVIFTLHDAIYIEDKVGNERMIQVLKDSMREATMHYIDEEYKEIAGQIRMDAFAWSPDYVKDSVINMGSWQLDVSNQYIDARSLVDFNKFSKYFSRPDSDLLK